MSSSNRTWTLLTLAAVAMATLTLTATSANATTMLVDEDFESPTYSNGNRE